MTSSESELEASSTSCLLDQAGKHRKVHVHRKSIMQASIAESMKSRQVTAKATRDKQKARIDGRHKYMIGLIADMLKLDTATVEDFIVDGDQVILYNYNSKYIYIIMSILH